jgi:hypothetical protein
MSRVEFDSTKKPLDDLLKKAHEGIIQLPDFQRGWVWDDDSLRSLLASISRAFPVGALMTLESGGEVRFKPRLIEGAPETHAARSPESLLLDGQQRITSLYQTTMRQEVVNTTNAKREKIDRWYYIDMKLAMKDGANREEAIVGVPANKIETRDFGRQIVRDLSTPEKEYEQCMFPTNQIFDPRKWEYGFEEDYWRAQGDPDKRLFYRKFADEVLDAFKRYQMPVIELGRSTSREGVCLVFEKVNTAGKKLDAFELLTAIYAADGYELRKDWLGDKKTPGRALRLATSIHIPENVLSKLQPTEFLQAISLLYTLDRRREFVVSGAAGDPPAVTCTRDALLAIPLSAYQRYADRVETGFHDAGTFLFSQHIYRLKDVPYSSQLVPLAAIFTELGKKRDETATRRKLERWYWSGVFGELYGSTTESRFARDVQEVPAWILGGSEPTTVSDAIFRSDRLNTMTSRLSAAYKGVHALLMRQGAKDFRSSQPFDQTSYFSEAVDIHHIFPRKWCEDNKIPRGRHDTILNKTPLSYRTNRIVGGAAPSRYLKKLKEEGSISDADLDANIASHLINVGNLRADEFDAFIDARRKSLLDMIEKVTDPKTVYRGSAIDEPVGEVVEDEAETAEEMMAAE